MLSKWFVFGTHIQFLHISGYRHKRPKNGICCISKTRANLTNPKVDLESASKMYLESVEKPVSSKSLLSSVIERTTNSPVLELHSSDSQGLYA